MFIPDKVNFLVFALHLLVKLSLNFKNIHLIKTFYHNECIFGLYVILIEFATKNGVALPIKNTLSLPVFR